VTVTSPGNSDATSCLSCSYFVFFSSAASLKALARLSNGTVTSIIIVVVPLLMTRSGLRRWVPKAVFSEITSNLPNAAFLMRDIRLILTYVSP